MTRLLDIVHFFFTILMLVYYAIVEIIETLWYLIKYIFGFKPIPIQDLLDQQELRSYLSQARILSERSNTKLCLRLKSQKTNWKSEGF
jgi:hypothetical protein